jgi:hypothetical protein
MKNRNEYSQLKIARHPYYYGFLQVLLPAGPHRRWQAILFQSAPVLEHK